MTLARRLPTDVRKIIDRPWVGDADRIVQEKLQELQNVTQGLPPQLVNAKGDLVTFSTLPITLSIGPAGYALLADPTTVTGLAYVDIASLANNVIANMVYGG